MIDLLTRRVPGHHWVRLLAGRTARGSVEVEAAHGWMFGGRVRRDAWRLGRVSLVLLRMPRAPSASGVR